MMYFSSLEIFLIHEIEYLFSYSRDHERQRAREIDFGHVSSTANEVVIHTNLAEQ